ncbi:MAG: hypothetical protein JW841_00075 [Deltaproteobacteria bacterium]|nr:hypothetical protein [Deltaproteobacteria bacterium]
MASIRCQKLKVCDGLWEAWQLRSEEPPGSFNEIVDDVYKVPMVFGGRRYAQLSRQERLRQTIHRHARELWWAYHTDINVRRAWYKTIEVELNTKWNEAIASVQDMLAKKIVDAHIVIEVNPSSNITLGPFDDMIQHPIFRWLNPKNDLTASNKPMIVVGSDDPSVFATELIHEYAYLGRAAQELNATPRQISVWLDHLRDSGVKYSFFPRESFKR